MMSPETTISLPGVGSLRAAEMLMASAGASSIRIESRPAAGAVGLEPLPLPGSGVLVCWLSQAVRARVAMMVIAGSFM